MFTENNDFLVLTTPLIASSKLVITGELGTADCYAPSQSVESK